MRAITLSVGATLLLWAFAWLAPARLLAQEATVAGELLDPASYGPGVVESMEAAIERDRHATPPKNDKVRQPGEHGVWMVPGRGATTFPHSGLHNAVNKWGDTHMGIGFPAAVDVHGAFFAGQAAKGAWTPAIRVRGYRDGQVVQETDWFGDIGATPRWLDLDLHNVECIEIVSIPVLIGGGWYGMDDLTYSIAGSAEPAVVVDFEDLPYDTKLTGSGYAGLSWETGSGTFVDAVHGPLHPPGYSRAEQGSAVDEPAASGTRATSPDLVGSFQGAIRGDAGSMSYPPDTIGAVGPNHYVETVNRNFAIYNKANGAQLTNILLGSFLPGSNGDPRVLYDQHSGRWIVLVTDFSATATVFLAVSQSSDAMGSWFKTSFVTAQGADAGKWPDYPTLGVDANGIYTSAYMVGGTSGMTIFAINKAPLVAPTPSLGAVTAFRNLAWEGAIQPAHTYGTSAGEYLVSYASSSSLRVRRINPPLTAPTLTEVGMVSVPSFSAAADAPALGSTTDLDTVDQRLMMAVYRDGSLWTAHTINVGGVSGRAGCRWYEINAAAHTLVQSGTVADATLWYYFPSIMVNENGAVAMGFTGSSATQYASCYYTGRLGTEPLGEMAPPVMYKAGTAAQNNIDSYGRNRWGDYSQTTLDPSDDVTFWTIQEYGHASDIWGTYVGILSLTPLPDCNGNGIPDEQDIASGTSQDCNLNTIPDECEPATDCNGNSIQDFCDIYAGTSLDCNANGVPDECDLAGGTSQDCNSNGIPDDCEVGLAPYSLSFPLDAHPGWSATGQWAFGPPTGQGGANGYPDPTTAATNANVYGVNLSGDYATTYGGPYYLTLGPVDLTYVRDVTLKFQRWLNSDYEPYVSEMIQVSQDGSTWVNVWSNGSTLIAENSWSLRQVDVSATADQQPAVYVRFGYQIGNGAMAYSGWNIDDVEFAGLAPGGGTRDCNHNSVPDECDIADGTSQDCNANAVPDECDIASGTSQDANGDGVPDECAVVLIGDANCDGTVSFGDINPFVLALTDQPTWQATYPGCPLGNLDINGDSTVNFGDINPFVALLSGGG